MLVAADAFVLPQMHLRETLETVLEIIARRMFKDAFFQNSERLEAIQMLNNKRLII